MKPYLGCIADDFTGGTDLASMLTDHGMRTLQLIGVPHSSPLADVDALVIALKSRTIDPELAIIESLEALAYLQASGCSQIYFKYCSTFDSTDRGNIGPVTDALMTALNIPFTIACPAFPENKRTIYQGYLFAGGVPLNESGMQNHPLTPMRDANLVRVLQRQTARKVGLIPIEIIRAGVEAMRTKISALQTEGVEIAIVDALANEDLVTIGSACSELKLLTAGSGVALGVTKDLAKRGVFARNEGGSSIHPAPIPGRRAILAGSCSTATQKQVRAAISSGMPAFAIDPLSLAARKPLVEEVLQWAGQRLEHNTVLIYATADQERVQSVQAALGVDEAGRLVEDALALIAQGLIELDVRQLVVAGGETSGAVVKALKIEGLRTGQQIVPGVPWTTTISRTPINLALKSGNFGGEDFFLSCWNFLK